MTSAPSIQTTALQYLEAGFSLFPLAYRTKQPNYALLPKEAAKATWKPFTLSKPSPEQVQRWFAQGRHNLALVMGAVSGNVAAIDFDQAEAYHAWADEYPEIAQCTATAATGRGFHVLVRLEHPVRNWKVQYQGRPVGEMRGESGYIAVWPSIHPTGAAYAWLRPPWEGLVTVANLGSIGLAVIGAPVETVRYLPPRTTGFMSTGAASGGRGVNDELYHAAIQHAAAGYAEAETLAALLPVAERFYIGTGPGNTAAQAVSTIKSGWKGGLGKERLVFSPAGNGASPAKVGNGASPVKAENVHQVHPRNDSLKPAFAIENGQIVYTTYKKLDDGIVPIRSYIPFTAQVTRKLILYAENGQRRVTYTITGEKDHRPYALEVEAADFADGKKLFTRLLDYLPGGPPNITNTLISAINSAISAVTDEERIEKIKAVPYTGWTPDGKAFVMPSGSVGDGFVCRFEEDIANEFTGFGLRQNSVEENQAALKALLDLRQVYSPEAVYVVLAHAFLPPLLRWLGTQARYLLHIHAGSGSLKTELAKLLMALYRVITPADLENGKDAEAITYKWSATPYGAESRAHALKDCLMLIDDLKPNTITPDVLPRWVAFVQSYVDATGRKRATISGKGAASLPPRAVLISTGEAIPEAGEASYTARMLLVELVSRPANAPRDRVLDKIREEAAPLFSGLMRSYIEWLIAENGAKCVDVLKSYQAKAVQAAHSRLLANYAANSTAAFMFSRFCFAQDLMTGKEMGEFQAAHQAAILRVVSATSDKVAGDRYSQKFIAALRDALSTGFAHVSDVVIDRNRVGWQDEEYVYLLNGSLAVVNQWLRMAGETPLIIPGREIKKQLFEDGYTFSTQGRVERGQYDLQRNDPADNSKPLVAAVYRARFYGEEISEEKKAA